MRGPLTAVASHCGGFSSRSTGSRPAGSVVGLCCGIFPDQASNPSPLHRQVSSYPLGPQGSPCSPFRRRLRLFHWTVKGNGDRETLETLLGYRGKRSLERLCLTRCGGEGKENSVPRCDGSDQEEELVWVKTVQMSAVGKRDPGGLLETPSRWCHRDPGLPRPVRAAHQGLRASLPREEKEQLS